MVEILGIIASIFVVLSFTFNGEKRIRKANLCGAVLFFFYGLLIGSASVTITNGILSVLQIKKITQNKTKHEKVMAWQDRERK